MFDIYQFCVEVTDPMLDFEVDPASLYPGMINRILDALEDTGLPDELIDITPAEGVDPFMAARRYLSEARAVPPQAWEWALIPRDEFDDDDERLTARARALEVARRWFTRALKNAHGPVAIRLTRDVRFRL